MNQLFMLHKLKELVHGKALVLWLEERYVVCCLRTAAFFTLTRTMGASEVPFQRLGN